MRSLVWDVWLGLLAICAVNAVVLAVWLQFTPLEDGRGGAIGELDADTAANPIPCPPAPTPIRGEDRRYVPLHARGPRDGR